MYLSIFLFIDGIFLSIPIDKPSIRFIPICLKTFEGELTPKTFLTAVVILSPKLVTLFIIQFFLS